MKPLVTAVVAIGAIALLSWLWGSRPDSILNEGPIQAPQDTYDPVRAGKPTPDGYRQLLGRDQIAPVYNPRFTVESDWTGDTLVIGVALDGEAKAYPVSFLNHREMVIDSIGGTPVLVTW